ncbi:hypothetical protein [Pacificoceanicola onchidii]|uniref:hypothetical protein n=1 Tax=Pacificoceanicola onchidii TaxID=2562685 RepID=UPI0010A6387D|nr:hypothetical protein [Pacificoceanicola onchidii]
MPETEFDPRIRFDDARQIMEVDFTDLHFQSGSTVNQFYDRIEERIAESGESLWFFLVNLNGMRIDPAAWVDYARRGRALNQAHSMGSVRFDASPETAAQIERDARTERFDPNLFTSREDAIVRLDALPSKRRATGILHDPNYAPGDFVRRVSFDHEAGILEIDFSHFTFFHARDVGDFYDHIEERIRDTGQDKWFFLINYDGCRIEPAAWVQHAFRGKKINLSHSLGTVRYAPGSETEEEIRRRATAQDFRPNIRNTRAEALARIDEMREESVV